MQFDLKRTGAGAAASFPDQGEPAGSSGAVMAARLAREWEALQRHALWPTQTHGCIMALCRTLLADARTWIVTAGRDAGGQGCDAGGLLPLCRDGGYLARWRIMGADELFEPTDALYSDYGNARELAATLAVQPRALHFDRISAGSLLVPALRSAMKGRGLVLVRPAMPSPMISLDESWVEPERHFNAGRRSDVRRARRRAETLGAVSLETLSPAPEAFDALFDEAVGVELLGWKKEAGTAIGADPGQLGFFRDYFRDACARGLFRVSFLRIDGKAVAMQLALQWAERYWLFKIGHDSAYDKCSPGTLLMLHSIGDAAQRGLLGYEFLGVIEPWITRFWTQEQHECVQLRTYPFNPRGAAALMTDGAFWLGQRFRHRWLKPARA